MNSESLAEVSQKRLVKLAIKSAKAVIATRGINTTTRKGSKELELLIKKITNRSLINREQATQIGQNVGEKIVDLSVQKEKSNLDKGVVRQLASQKEIFSLSVASKEILSIPQLKQEQSSSQATTPATVSQVLEKAGVVEQAEPEILADVEEETEPEILTDVEAETESETLAEKAGVVEQADPEILADVEEETESEILTDVEEETESETLAEKAGVVEQVDPEILADVEEETEPEILTDVEAETESEILADVEEETESEILADVEEEILTVVDADTADTVDKNSPELQEELQEEQPVESLEASEAIAVNSTQSVGQKDEDRKESQAVE